MSQWMGKLFVFKDPRGQDQISADLPPKDVDKSQIRAFQVVGPYMPVGWPRPALVSDPAKWMADLEKDGFRFEPCSVE